MKVKIVQFLCQFEEFKMFHYTVSASHLTRHLFHVSLSFYNEKDVPITVVLPNWTIGSYMIRDYAQNIVQVYSICDNLSHPLQQIRKNAWRTLPIKGLWKIEYDVYAFDSSVRAAFLDQNHAFFDGASLLMFVENHEDKPCEISFRLPERWQTIVPLPEKDGVYRAENYRALLDAPMLSGCLKHLFFEVCGIPHHIWIDGDAPYLDENRLIEDVAKICQQHIQMFAHAPFERYDFLLRVTENGYGGLEHLSSSSLLMPRSSLPSLRREVNRNDYIVLLGLFSHEYFHAWNVKTLRPKEFLNYDLQHENYTEQLWAFEGITAYYDDLALVRCGVITPQEYLSLLSKTITTVRSQAGLQVQSLAQASFNAWTKAYHPNENSENTTVSYYKKGSLLALCCDATLRAGRGKFASLDEVMKHFYHQAIQGKNGITMDDWRSLFDHHFDDWVYQACDLPLEASLQQLGIDVQTKPNPIAFGARLKDQDLGKKVMSVQHHSHAEAAGINAQDIIVAINHRSVSRWDEIWQEIQAGDTVVIHYFRDVQLFETSFVAQEETSCQYLLKLQKSSAWLAGK